MNRVASSRARARAREVYVCVYVSKSTRMYGCAHAQRNVRDGAHVDTIQDEAPGAVRLMKLMRAAVLNQVEEREMASSVTVLL